MIESFTKNLFDAICGVFPGLNEESMTRLHDHVSICAALLEAKVHLSSVDYIFQYDGILDSQQIKHMPIRVEGLAEGLFVDVKTRRTVKAGPHLKTDNDGFVGQPLLTLEPSMHRQGVQGELKMLRPRKLLTAFYSDASRHN